MAKPKARTFTTDEKIKAIKREIAMRKTVYPRNVAAHRMTQEEADYQIALMEDLLADLERAKSYTPKP